MVFAIISAGPDHTFQTSCANLKGGVVNGDDIAQFYTIAGLRTGRTGTIYYAAAVKDTNALNALPTTGLQSGTIRPVNSDNSLVQWNGSYWKTLTSGAPGILGQSFKNYLINGNFTLTQRNGLGSIAWTGKDQTYCSMVSCSLYHPDRWRIRFGTSGTNSKLTLTETIYAFTPGGAGNPPGAVNYVELVPSALTGTLTYFGLEQGLEPLPFFQGKQMVLSFWAKSPTPVTVTVKSDASYGYGGSGSYTPLSTTTLGSITTNSGWTQFNIPFTVPLPASAPTYTTDLTGTGWFTIYFSVTAMQTLDLALVQLEDGSAATPFEFRPPGVELTLAQHFYQKSDPTSKDSVFSGYYNRSAYIRRTVYLKNPMQFSPWTSYTESSTQMASGTLTNAGDGNLTTNWRVTSDTTTGMKSSMSHWFAEAEYGQ